MRKYNSYVPKQRTQTELGTLQQGRSFRVRGIRSDSLWMNFAFGEGNKQKG